MADKTDDLVIGISTDLTTIKRQLRQLGQTITQETAGYSKGFESFGKRMDAAVNTTGVQKRINQLTGIAAKSTKEWTGALADQGKELTRLRAQYNPIFSAIKQYQASVVEIQTANRVGAISTDEMTRAIQRERQATLSSIAAIKQRNTAQRGVLRGGAGNSFNTANIAAQFQDIGVTAAMGMNPLQIALQQGTQLSMVLEQMKGTGQSTGRALLGAFTSIISPISLVTIGLIAAGAAAAQYFFSTSEKAKKLDDVLSEHSKAVSELRKAYGIAGDAAEDFGRKSTAALEAAARSSAAALREAIAAEEKNVKSGLSDSGGFSGFGLLQRIGLLGGDDLKAVKLQFAAFAEPIEKLRQQIKEGKPDYDAFQQSLAAIVATDPQNLQPIADKIQLIISKAADGRGELDSMSDALDQITQNQFDTANIVAGFGNIVEAAKSAQDSVNSFATMLAHLNQIASGIDAKGNRIGGKGAMDAAQQNFSETLNFQRRINPDLFGDIKHTKAPKAASGGSRFPRRTADDRFSEDIKAIQARTQALAMERGLLGATYAEQIKRNTAFDLEQKALKQVREEARRKGDQDWQNAQLTPEMVKQIDEASDAYARQADALKKTQEAMDFARDLTRGFLDDFVNDLKDGKNVWESFGDAALGVLDKISSKLLDMATDDLINGIFGGSSGFNIASLFGGGGISSTAMAAVMGGAGGLYADGGFTGVGGKNVPAGIVHKGEVVWSQADVARAGGVGMAEALRRGAVPVARGGGTSTTVISPQISVDARGAQQGVGAEIAAALDKYSRHTLPQLIKQVNADPRKRG